MGGILIGLLVPAVLKRSIGRERITNGDSNQGDADSNYSYPEFHSKSLGEVHETITDRPEKDEIQ